MSWGKGAFYDSENDEFSMYDIKHNADSECCGNCRWWDSATGECEFDGLVKDDDDTCFNHFHHK